MRGNTLIGVWVKDGLVNTVDDATELRRTSVQNSLQALGIVRHHNLLGIAGADRIDPIGKHTACFQEVGAAVEFHELWCIVLRVNAQQILHLLKSAFTLERDIMDRQQVAQILLHAAAILGLAQHGDHGCMPVVAVQNVRCKVKVGDRVQYGTGKEGVLLQLRIAAAINAVAEIALIIDKINGHAIKDKLFNADVFTPPAKLCIEIKHMLHFVGVFVLDDAVIRCNHTRVNPQRGQRFWQRANHVGQAACLGERCTFGRYQKHVGKAVASAFL